MMIWRPCSLESVRNSAAKWVTCTSSIDCTGSSRINQGSGPTIRDVIRAVSDHYGLQPRDIMRRDRHAKVAQARQVAYFLCYELTGCTFAQIGRAMEKSPLTTREGYEAAFRLANQYSYGFGADLLILRAHIMNERPVSFP
jgi:hypothetical protein